MNIRFIYHKYIFQLLIDINRYYFFDERNCFHLDTEPENLAWHRLSLVISLIQSNKGHY